MWNIFIVKFDMFFISRKREISSPYLKNFLFCLQIVSCFLFVRISRSLVENCSLNWEKEWPYCNFTLLYRENKNFSGKYLVKSSIFFPWVNNSSRYSCTSPVSFILESIGRLWILYQYYSKCLIFFKLIIVRRRN